jgi:hypothetical protein
MTVTHSPRPGQTFHKVWNWAIRPFLALLIVGSFFSPFVFPISQAALLGLYAALGALALGEIAVLVAAVSARLNRIDALVDQAEKEISQVDTKAGKYREYLWELVLPHIVQLGLFVIVSLIGLASVDALLAAPLLLRGVPSLLICSFFYVFGEALWYSVEFLRVTETPRQWLESTRRAIDEVPGDRERGTFHRE